MTAQPPSAYAEFGEAFLRTILHKQRVLDSVDRILGDRIEIGPIGAGPGRVFARARAVGLFQPAFGEALPGPLLAYRVIVPIEVDFEVDLAVDVHRFHASVQVPVVLTARIEDPAVLHWDITMPSEDEVQLVLETTKRRSQVLQRVAGLEEELRRFLLRVIEKELAKPHVVKATRIDFPTIVDSAWPALADQFLPVRDPDTGEPVVQVIDDLDTDDDPARAV